MTTTISAIAGLSNGANSGNSTISRKSPFKRNARKAFRTNWKTANFGGTKTAYFRVDDFWGFKFYDSREKAVLNYHRQAMVDACCGRAPKLGDYIIRFKLADKVNYRYSKLFWKWPKICYGFFTEHCPQVTYEEGQKRSHHKAFKDMVHELDHFAGRQESITYDLNYSLNVGYNHSGRLVAIDFGTWQTEGSWLHSHDELKENEDACNSFGGNSSGPMSRFVW